MASTGWQVKGLVQTQLDSCPFCQAFAYDHAVGVVLSGKKGTRRLSALKGGILSHDGQRALMVNA